MNNHNNEVNIFSSILINSTTYAVDDLLDNTSIPYDIPSSDSLLSYLNSKQDEATKFKVGPYALYKSTKAHVTGINIPNDPFEDIIYAISNRKEKSKHVTNDMLSLSTLIQ